MMGLGLAVKIYVPLIIPNAFRIVFAIQWAVAGDNAIAFAATPEFINFVGSKGRLAHAHEVMALVYGNNNAINYRFAYLKKVIREEKSIQHIESWSIGSLRLTWWDRDELQIHK